MKNKITPCLWFDGDAEEAAEFYVSLVPDSRIESKFRSPTDTHSGPSDSVLTVDFTLAGQRYVGLNGGPMFKFSEAVSFQIHCDNQEEVDRVWDALLDGGQPMACGWIKDRWGLTWQIVPTRLLELINDPDSAKAKRAMESMMTMMKIDIAELEKTANGEKA
ncbi:VOC family protein [Cerasicoccus fimbriatus]|uniref:VOC family protein n=1 Tax=Cerasicoccus fimbriatus TaxID=3014554 RepID=UPI0022B3A885|nr:VOC family protein [Cerasicoccus sp. TK19100]